jgi:hypothetical protein
MGGLKGSRQRGHKKRASSIFREEWSGTRERDGFFFYTCLGVEYGYYYL